MTESILQHPQNENQLSELWCSCFPEDADGYCDFFLSRWFRPDRCLVIRSGEIVQSMVHLFTADYLQHGVHCGSFLYLYAIGTAPAYRGNGNLGKLLQGCLELARSKGLSGILLTSAVGLESLYEHYGMERCAVRYETVIKPRPAAPLPWETCSFEAYAAMRREYLASLPAAFSWQPDSDRFFYEVQQDSGAIIQWQEDGNLYYAVTGIEEEMPTLLETNHPLIEGFLNRIAASMGNLPEFKVCSPDPIDETSEPVCFGHWILTDAASPSAGNAYLNIIAD